MFWSDSSGRAYRARLNGTGSQQLATGLGTPCKFSVSMHQDCKSGTAHKYGCFRDLRSWDKQCTESFTFSTDGIGWDWVNQKLYWTDATYKRIGVIDPSINSQKVLFTTGVNSNPRNIIVDPSTR